MMLFFNAAMNWAVISDIIVINLGLLYIVISRNEEDDDE